jgi:chorismate--pyruvate lyase
MGFHRDSSRPAPTGPLRWSSAPQSARRAPASLRPWLSDSGSLTARLQAHSAQPLQVQVLRQGWGRPQADEVRRTGMQPQRMALIREVLLLGNGQPWVYARSILPATSLQGSRRFLRWLDQRPLGSLLFRYPGMYRDGIEITRIAAPQACLPAAVRSATPVWGRRSCFYLEHHPVLVSEFFLDNFCASLDRKPGSGDTAAPPAHPQPV